MTMEHNENELGKLGDEDLAEIISSVHKAFRKRHPDLGDIALPSAAIPDVPRPTRIEFGKIVLPDLHRLVGPQLAPEGVRNWKEKGFNNFDFFRFSARQIEQDEDYPSWDFKPGSWFWDNVENGSISPDATRLGRMLIAIDNTPKPNSNNGRQLYENDPFGDLLKELRREGKIKVTGAFRNIPQTSRFGISPVEIVEHVLPAMASMLGVNSKWVRLPTEMEYNMIGNRSHPEWGDTSTWELMMDRFEGSRYLIGGRSSGGSGLSNVDCVLPSGRNDNVAFRPVIVLYP